MSTRKAMGRAGVGTIDWRKWLLIPHDKLWRVVAISVGIEPDDMIAHDGMGFGFDLHGIVTYPKKFLDRLHIAEGNLGDALPAVRIVEESGHRHLSLVRFDAFGRFAKQIGLSLPARFPSPSNGQEVGRREDPGSAALGPRITLPYSTQILEVVAQVMRETWCNVDPGNLPKQESVAADIAKRLSWGPTADGSPTRLALALASAIRPDEYRLRDRRVSSRGRKMSPTKRS